MEDVALKELEICKNLSCIIQDVKFQGKADMS